MLPNSPFFPPLNTLQLDFKLTIRLATEVKMFQSLFSIVILHVARMVYAQHDPSGFISIDCGQDLNYTDNVTGLNYVSDNGFIEGGTNNGVLQAYTYVASELRLTTLRSFPQKKRSCYTLRPQQGKNNRYLIRAEFYYGNYDSRGENPQFDLYLGADYWATVNNAEPLKAVTHEIIFLTTSDYINVCLENTGHGKPFISALQLRLLNITMYRRPLASLLLLSRIGFGINERLRYEDDIYDREWYPLPLFFYRVVTSSNTPYSGDLDVEKVPPKVISTAITPTISTNDIYFTWYAANTTDNFIFYIYLAEVEMLESNQTREFNIYVNEEYYYGPFSPTTNIRTISNQYPFNGSSSYTVKINKTTNSGLPPILNAIEVFTLKHLLQNVTNDQDAAAIWSIKSTYGLKGNWEGDPCVPYAFHWDSLNCSYSDPVEARIISLNLSSRGLSGEIATALDNLTMIESLDLSYNNLSGSVPGFLAQKDNLRILNLMGNNFTRPLPDNLLAKSKKGSLLLSIEAISDEEKNACLKGSCVNKKHSKGVIAVIATLSALVVLLIILLIINSQKGKDVITLQDEFLTPKKQQFTYFQVESITNNFETVIGEGAFGTVFQGSIGDNQVAVKMLSKSSTQGYKEFQAEVKILMDIHHKNITSLVGYCDDKDHKGIIYEYMANGNLEKHLFDGSPNVLSWERRLQIGCDVAEGLAYMHHGCTPSIVHRDIKSSNILLNEGFQAKLGDFGLSRAFKTVDATHVATTRGAGTPGYLDPEYQSTGRLTEKSDVYSFGVVLLELITSRRATSGGIHIVFWVKSTVEEGGVENIIDPRLEEQFNINIAWKLFELANACVSPTSIGRPTMNEVVIDLKQCLHAEKSCHGSISLITESMRNPEPR